MRPRCVHILQLVAAEYRLNPVHIVSPMRYPIYVEARATFIHAARAFGYSVNRIGEVAQRHHATVLHSLKRDPESLPKLPAVMSRLTPKADA